MKRILLYFVFMIPPEEILRETQHGDGNGCNRQGNARAGQCKGRAMQGQGIARAGQCKGRAMQGQGNARAGHCKGKGG